MKIVLVCEMANFSRHGDALALAGANLSLTSEMKGYIAFMLHNKSKRSYDVVTLKIGLPLRVIIERYPYKHYK